MSLNFKEITLADRSWMNPLFALSERGSLEYNFTTSFIWRHIYSFRAMELGGYLILVSDPENPSFLFPPGQGPLEPVITALSAYSHEKGVPLCFNTVLAADKKRLEQLYPGKFQFELLRDGADYLYDRESLAELTGKKLSSKRNHIHRFLDNHPDWRYEPLTKDNLEDARQMHKAWCIQAGCGESAGLTDESCAVEQAFRHYFDLKLDGGLIRAGGQVMAFTMGEPLNESTYLVHVEKAFYDIQGAYPMINQQFVQHACAGYSLVNREEDAGEEGLRKAKLSYQPVSLVEKYSATLLSKEEAL